MEIWNDTMKRCYNCVRIYENRAFICKACGEMRIAQMEYMYLCINIQQKIKEYKKKSS